MLQTQCFTRVPKARSYSSVVHSLYGPVPGGVLNSLGMQSWHKAQPVGRFALAQMKRVPCWDPAR